MKSKSKGDHTKRRIKDSGRVVRISLGQPASSSRGSAPCASMRSVAFGFSSPFRTRTLRFTGRNRRGGARSHCEKSALILTRAGSYLMARRGYTASEARICYERAEFLCNSVSGGWFPSALVGLFKIGLAVLLPASAFGFGAG